MTLKRGRILIADDNEDILFTLKMLLRPIAETITVTTDPRELLPILSRTHHDVILLDMNFRSDAVSGREGFRWLEEILKLDPKAVVIFITAYADTEKAVQAIKQGATDFIAKPWQNDKMIATVSAALQLSFSRTEVESLKEQKEALAAPSPEPTRIIGESAAMQAIFQTIRKLADTDANLLLLGENGTGKDLIARYVYEQSPRKTGYTYRSIWVVSPKHCSRANFSDMKKEHSRMHGKTNPAGWKWLREVRCSSTKSAISAFRYKPNCFRSSSNGRVPDWEPLPLTR